MLGHKWESAQGTIVDSLTLPPLRGRGSADRPVHRYRVEVSKPGSGEQVTGVIEERHAYRRPTGSLVSVQVHSHSDELRLDPNDPGPPPAMISIEEQMRETAAAAEAAGHFGGPAGSSGGASVFSTGGVHVRSGSMHVIGPGGQDLTADLQGEDISGLVHAMMSGDPAAKQAAAERIREIKAKAQQRAAEQQSVDAAAGSAFGQPAPSPFGGDQASFGSFGSFGSFDTGTGRGTPEQRLTALKQLLDKGVLTESEYAAKRQQIISEL